MYDNYDIESIRILPSDKETFKTEYEFRAFFENTIVQRAGEYYFPNLMMNCPSKTFVLFQYDGMIRATGVLVDLGKKTVVDERGVEYAGYYRFDVNTLHYLDNPVDKDTFKVVCPYFSGFSQSKQKISLDYLDDILTMLQKRDTYYVDKTITIQYESTNIEGIRKEYLLLNKEVDWSLVNWGLTLPMDSHNYMGNIGNRLLQKGEKKAVNLVIDGKTYDAIIVNEKFDAVKYPNRSSIIQLRYKKDVAELVRQLYKETSEFLFSNHEKEKEDKIPQPNSLRAYIGIYATNIDDTYIFECINTTQNDAANKIEEEISQLNLSGESKEAVVKVRVNQGVFRDKLLQRYNRCCLCGVSNSSFLIASHIKPWSESKPDEKLDVENGFLMCPNHDKLLDQGWITFSDEGDIVIANRLGTVDRMFLNVKDDMKVQLTEKNKKYLQYHRDNIFSND